jgi:predicted ArsR family transcriptional regulator
MDTPEPEPRGPLAQPTAARLFEFMSSARRRLSTAELARAMGIHPNSVRLHLSRLSEAGLVRRVTAAGGPGRPHYEWSISPRARVGAERPVAYRELAGWLTRSISELGGETGQIEAIGEQVGQEIASARRGADPAEALENAFAAMGYQPRRCADGPRTTFTLQNCPYRAVAKANPGVVCTLHRGTARGLTEGVSPNAELTGFVIRDPDRAGCVIEIEECNEHSAIERPSYAPA